jgi:hypothetical protein
MMRIRTTILAVLAAMTSLTVGVGVRAGTMLQTPAGLNPGDTFRFVFVTDGSRDATSTNITDYDNFVQSQAGGATYNGVVVNWLAIGSTATVNAIDHVGVAATPVYLVDGTLVTPNTGSFGLWSGQLIHAINENISGGTTQQSFVWTGTRTNGTGDLTNLELGSVSLDTEAGNPLTADSLWVSQVPFFQNAEQGLYGISQDLTVPQSVPEPTSMVLLCLGGVIVVGYGWTRRRQQRRQAAA